MMIDPWYQDPRLDAGPRTWSELVAVVRRQHAALEADLQRIRGLAGSAQLDVCLHARRTLAVHHSLERSLGLPHPGQVGMGRLVRAAEDAEATGDAEAISAAWSRVRVAFVRHVDQQRSAGRTVPSGTLDDSRRAAVVAAERLWEGRADAALGHEYEVMIGVALDQIREAAMEAPAPLVECMSMSGVGTTVRGRPEEAPMGKHRRDDVSSDPRLDDGTEADWSSEGGATPDEPATESDRDHSDDGDR